MECFYFLILFSLALFSQSIVFCYPLENADPTFDYLLLEQHWPVTECLHWKSLNTSNFCSFSQDQNAFSIHGLWPTKIGTKGPHNCGSDQKFDKNVLDPILTRMKLRWTNIHGGTDDYSFWAHEWNKHGTCAKILTPFNTILKYFSGTLDLNSELDLYGALNEYGITPGDQMYAIDDILSAVTKKFGKTPQVYCTFRNGEALLHSIKLCFDKNVKLIDCSSVGVSPRNCGTRKTLRYFKKVPDSK